MYAGRVACCPLVSHVEYAPRALLRVRKDGQTDGRTPDYITLTAIDAASVKSATLISCTQVTCLEFYKEAISSYKIQKSNSSLENSW